MSGNLHKSESGWVRLQARVNAREGVRAARMDHRVGGTSVPKVSKVEADAPSADGEVTITRKGRKRRRAFVAHNGRY